jgi:2-dehydro-3-deoxyglucarate aldolase/4-hydroxy-2-oxoheptanedioate aldolase
MRVNQTLARLRQGETVFGCAMQCYRTAEIPRVFAAAGFDYVFIDTEHGGFDFETVQDLVAAAVSAGITPVVRVCELLYSQVARTLDMGAQGIIFPRVEDPEVLAEAIQWTKFPPLGKRGFGVLPPLLDYEQQSMESITDHLNRNVMVVVQFETRRAMERSGELLSVPGVDVAMVGPADLSISLGVPGQFTHPMLVECIDRFIELCNRHGVVPGIHNRGVDGALQWAERGMRFIGAGSEQSLLLEIARGTMAKLREAQGAPSAAGGKLALD